MTRSSTNPSVRSLPIAFLARPPFGPSAGSRAPSSRCEAADSNTSCVSVSLFGDIVWISSGNDGVLRRHHRSPALAIEPAGQAPTRGQAPQPCATVTLCSHRKAGHFWRICWFAARQSMQDRGMGAPCTRKNVSRRPMSFNRRDIRRILKGLANSDLKCRGSNPGASASQSVSNASPKIGASEMRARPSSVLGPRPGLCSASWALALCSPRLAPIRARPFRTAQS
jgi:hypothetical protein